VITNEKTFGECCANKETKSPIGMDIRFKNSAQSVSAKEADLLMSVLASLLAAIQNDAAKVE